MARFSSDIVFPFPNSNDLNSREGNTCIAEPNLAEVLPLVICFIIVSLLPWKEAKKNIHGTVLIYEKNQ